MSDRSLTILCAMPDHGREGLEVLWFSPDAHRVQGFSRLEVECDFYTFFEYEEQRHVFQSHVTSRLHASASFLWRLAGVTWDVEVSFRDVVVLALERAHTQDADVKSRTVRKPVELGTGQQILDMLSSPVFVKDREHRWVLGNQAFWELIGKNAIGFSDYDLFPKEQADVFWEKDEYVFENRVAVSNEEQITSHDGSIRWLWTIKNPIDMPDGSTGLVGIITDITRRKLAEAQLVQNIGLRDEALASSRSKSQFLTSMSHELRTPLNAILGYTELLLEEAEDTSEIPASYLADLRRIHKATYHLLDLTNDVLDLSRIESGEINLELTHARVAPLVQECFETLEGMLEGDQRFVFRDESGWGGDHDVHLDVSRLKQVLLNLLGNAIKFTVSGAITVTMKRFDAQHFTLVVSDEGEGVDTEDHDKIFRPFERLHYENSSVLGTGLGLGLSRHLCRAMGGELDLVRTTSGQGATFAIRLPTDLDDRADALTRSSSSERLQNLSESQRHDVVVVSDSESGLSEMLGMFSKDLPIYLLRCTSIARLEELEAGKQISVVILDEPDRWCEELGLDSHDELIAHVETLSKARTPRVLCYERSVQTPHSRAYLPFPLTLSEWRTIVDTLHGDSA